MPPIDPDTLGLLYRQHAPALRLYARQWPGAAEDLVQEAFVKLARQSPPPERVLPWLYAVVRNGALLAGRSVARRPRRRPDAVRRGPRLRPAARGAPRLAGRRRVPRRGRGVARRLAGGGAVRAARPGQTAPAANTDSAPDPARAVPPRGAVD